MVVDDAGRVLFLCAELSGETRSVQSCAGACSRTFNRLSRNSERATRAIKVAAVNAPDAITP